MKTLKQLTENGKRCIYVLCETDEENKMFQKQAEEEGFLGLDGHTRPTEFPFCKHYGINADMTMGYVFGMAWYYNRRAKEHGYPVIDYGKYARGEEDYILRDAEEEDPAGKEGETI